MIPPSSKILSDIISLWYGDQTPRPVYKHYSNNPSDDMKYPRHYYISTDQNGRCIFTETYPPVLQNCPSRWHQSALPVSNLFRQSPLFLRAKDDLDTLLTDSAFCQASDSISYADIQTTMHRDVSSTESDLIYLIDDDRIKRVYVRNIKNSVRFDFFSTTERIVHTRL